MPKTGFKTKFYPNGEFSTGYVPPKGYDFEFKPDKPRGQKHKLASIDGYHVALQVLEDERVAKEAQLGSSLPPNCHKPRGQKGITRGGSRLVRQTAHILQQNYGHKCLSFLTLTLPPLTPQELLQCSKEWRRIIRVFCQRLRRALIEQGLPPKFVGVTEIQEKRFKARGEVALHVHLVFVGRMARSEHWRLAPKQIARWWLDVVSMVVDRHVDSSAVENLQMVKKSAAGYLGKYMSKGSHVCEAVVEQGLGEYLPSSWYTCCMELKRQYKKSIVVKWDDELDIIADLPRLCIAESVRQLHVSSIEMHGRSFMVGVSGKLVLPKVKAGFIHIYNAWLEVYDRYAVHSCSS